SPQALNRAVAREATGGGIKVMQLRHPMWRRTPRWLAQPMTAPRAPWLLPALAYSGIVVPQARTDRDTETLGRLGSLEVRLARKAADVRRAQKLRYKVFYREMSAIADAATLIAQRDFDAFDPICDHLLVLDHAARKMQLPHKPAVVGTYRLL